MLRMILLRMGISTALLGAPLILGDNIASGADTDTPVTVLDRQWESLMLEGKSLVLVNGDQLNSGGTPYQTYKGEVDQVWIADRGIRLDDLRETSLGGLLTKGGWRLKGGLLFAAAHKNGGMVELYGKSRWRVEPALFHFGKSPPPDLLVILTSFSYSIGLQKGEQPRLLLAGQFRPRTSRMTITFAVI